MGQVRTRGDSWELDYTDADGKRVRKAWGKRALVSEAEANIELKKRELAILEGKKQERQVPTLERYALDTYLPWNKTYFPHSHFRVESAFRVNILPLLGRYRLDELKVTLVEERYVAARRRGEPVVREQPKRGRPRAGIPTASTIKKELRCLIAALNRAVVSEKLDVNRAAGAKVPADKRSAPKIAYTVEEVELILAHEENPLYRDAWELLAFTGMRRSEMTARKGEDFHLTVAHRRAGTPDPEKPHVLVLSTEQHHTKDAEWRYIPLAPRAQAAALRLMDAHDGPYLLPMFARESLSRAFKRTLKKAGMPGSLKTLRHTFATLLVRHTKSLKFSQEILGHSSSTMTENYTHLLNDDLHRAVETM